MSGNHNSRGRQARRGAPRAPRLVEAHPPIPHAPEGAIRVKLARGKSKPFWLGHPWVFSGAIDEIAGNFDPLGAPCVLVDERESPVALGYYTPNAPIAVRLYWHRRSTEQPFTPPALEQLLRERIHAALQRRQLFGLLKAGSRIIHGEGDLLPGLEVDHLGEGLRLRFTSRTFYAQRQLIAQVLHQRLGTQWAILSVDEASSRQEALPVQHEEINEKPLPETFAFTDGAIPYRLSAQNPQSVETYPIHRDNRQRFAALCKGKRVLDLYSHHGGFGIQAALAGAEDTILVEFSKHGIEASRQAIDALRLSNRTQALQADAIVFLKEQQATQRQWDRIVIDPPGFIQNPRYLRDGLQKYARINTLALASLAEGGLLLTTSHSPFVSDADFERMLTEAGHRLRRHVQIFERWTQPADFPSLSVFPESGALKAWLIGLA